MTKVVRRRSAKTEELRITKTGNITTYDLGLYRGTKRSPVAIGVDPGRASPAVCAYSPEDGTAFLWLIRPKHHWTAGLAELQTAFSQILANIKMRTSWVHHIAFENYSYGEDFQLASMGEAGGVIKLALIKAFGVVNQVAYPTLVAPNQLKKFATGSGQSRKNVIMLSVFKKWGVELRDDNLADSYTLARIAAALGTGKTDHAYEREVIERLRANTEWQPLDPGQKNSNGRTSKSKSKAPRSRSSE